MHAWDKPKPVGEINGGFPGKNTKQLIPEKSQQKAQLLLGHTTEGMTEHYRRKKREMEVLPMK